MKTFIYYLLILFAFVACNEEQEGGEQEPINPERNEATIGADGGTISIKTETTFWLHYIVEYEDGVEKQSIFNELEGEEEPLDYRKVMSGDWYQVEEREKEVYFEIAPNETGKERAIKVEIECGDAFDQITVTQTAD